jgi:hypothetical protein
MRGLVLTSRCPAFGAGAGPAKHRPRGARRPLWLCLIALAVVATAAWAQQTPTEQAPRAQTMVARRQANIVEVNGKPTVLVWARGLTDVADLDQYAAAGMNTAYVTIEHVSEEALASASSLADAAEARGLMVVAALAPSALLDAEGDALAIDPRSADYAAAVADFVGKAAASMSGHPALIAWSVEAVPPGDVVWDDAGFGGYLQEWYPSLAAVNESWWTEFGEWDDITVDGVLDVDQTNPGGLGRATVDFAIYREMGYADVLSLWAEAIRASDAGRLVFASALTDYRSVISVPTTFDGMVLNVYPSVAEADVRTHNVHAVDIARRANAFAVVQTLEVSSAAGGGAVLDWAALALHHGAAGVALSSWEAVRGSEELRTAASDIARGSEELGYFPAEPRPRAAILYEPMAGGSMRGEAGLYGYLDGFAPNETAILGAVRNGSRFGQFDVLGLSSFGEADLGQYGVIIAPMALFLPQDAQMALNNYVMAGGTLVADAGVGMYQADGIVTSVPEVMQQVLGVRSGLAEDMWSTPPAGEVQVGGPGDTGVPATDMPEGGQITGNQDLERLVDIVGEVLDRPLVADYLGIDFLADGAPKLWVKGLGRGYAVYAPWLMYQEWDSSDPYFVAFHARVLSSGSDLEVTEPDELWPGVSAAVYADWSVGVASPDGVPTAVAVYGAGNEVFDVPAGAMRLGNPAEGDWVELLFPGARLSVAKPLPIYVWTVDEGAVVTVSVREYSASRVELLVSGTGARATVEPDGVAADGGVRTAAEIDVRDGTYRVPAGSVHKVVVREGASGRVSWEQEVMPDAETGALVIQGAFAGARVIIERAAETG